jgi:hypothetical protein
VSRDDLLADLQKEASVRPAAPPVPPQVPPGYAGTPTTPALDVSLTPLKWSLPRLGAAARGLGLSVAVGPVKVSLAVR